MGRFSTLFAISSTAILIAWSSPCAAARQLSAGPQFPRTLREATLLPSVSPMPTFKPSQPRPYQETLAPKKSSAPRTSMPYRASSMSARQDQPVDYSILHYSTAPRPAFPPARMRPEPAADSVVSDDAEPGIQMQFGDRMPRETNRPIPLTNQYRKPERDVAGNQIAEMQPLPTPDSSPFRQASTENRISEDSNSDLVPGPENMTPNDARDVRGSAKDTGEAAPVSIEISGPRQLITDQAADWIINVSNYQTIPSRELLVRLYIPDGLTITRFDRQAWLDQENRSVVFRIVDLPASSRQEIRFRGLSQQSGTHVIRLELLDEQIVDATELDFQVRPGAVDQE